MKKSFLQFVFVGVYAISIGTAGAVLAVTNFAVARPLGTCPACRTIDLSCPGSTCGCNYNTGSQSYVCSMVQ